MKTYGSIASMPNDWLFMRQVRLNPEPLVKAIASMGVTADTFSFNAFAAVRASGISISNGGN